MPSAWRLTWNQFAPLTTVSKSLKVAFGMPACSQASSSAMPTGSSAGTSMRWTGPSVPFRSPERFMFVRAG